MRIELGTVAASEAARVAVGPQKRPRFGLAVLFSGDRGKREEKDDKPTIEKLELELPGEALVVSPPTPCDCKIVKATASALRGSEMSLVVDGTLGSGGRNYAIHLDVTTFVRDVVAEEAGARVLPALHPPLPAATRR
jgi:hypothetical protein